jgi:lysophospholipase L1-like esterase
MQIQPNSKILFIGDSITDCGRTKPGPSEGLFDPLGKGYVSFIDAMLTAVYPEAKYRVVNVGISGNTVRELKARWQTDVIDLKPDWLSVMIGINDVWRQFDVPKLTEQHVPLDEYERTLDELLARVRPALKGLVLMTPYYIESNRDDAMRLRMGAYGAVVKELASKHGAVFVDTQAAIDRALGHLYPAALAWDRVHPNQGGHMILAKAFLDAVGFDWKRG